MTAETLTREHIAAELGRVRGRTLGLVDPLSEADQVAQHSPLMSPLVWDLAHIGNYEELWLQRALGGPAAEHPEYDDLYDAFQHPRPDRPALPILGPAEARAYVAGVRDRVLAVLDRVDLGGASGDPLLQGAFVYGMVIQHEHQHDETMVATRQLMGEGAPALGTSDGPGASKPLARGDEVMVPGGNFVMGTDTEPWAYDNERPAHPVTLAPFAIDTAPVTNGDYRSFIEDGGYQNQRWWGDPGWAHRQHARLEAPLFWRQEDAAWCVLRFGSWQPIGPDEPVQHVCWYEADAYARWTGKRLPTEAEWEYAASWDPVAGAKRRYPWGDIYPYSPLSATSSAGRSDPRSPRDHLANLGQLHAGPAEVGAYPTGASPVGCHQMVGDVWEWTASDFLPYPGFRSFPYREYSEVFWGPDYKVLRGGSWATDPLAVRTTFRNWDLPIRRQIFAGFRCARDV